MIKNKLMKVIAVVLSGFLIIGSTVASKPVQAMNNEQVTPYAYERFTHSETFNSDDFGKFVVTMTGKINLSTGDIYLVALDVNATLKGTYKNWTLKSKTTTPGISSKITNDRVSFTLVYWNGLTGTGAGQFTYSGVMYL